MFHDVNNNEIMMQRRARREKFMHINIIYPYKYKYISRMCITK